MTAHTGIRPPAVSGTFYPADPAVLRRTVDRDVAAASSETRGVVHPKAVIAPHAGYVYSGPVAGAAYARLAPLRGRVERVVLLGPAHRVRVRGLAVPSVDVLETPLGPVRVDSAARDAVLVLGCVQVDDAAHAPEHSLEVQLPFVQRVLGDVAVLPLVVGDARPAEVASVLDTVWGGAETLIIVSSDLSHYHDYETAVRRDRETAHAIVDGEVDAVGTGDACGAHPVRGLMLAAKRHDLDVEILDLRNSGDTAGRRDRVVGYGAFAFTERLEDEVARVVDTTALEDAGVQRLLLDTAVDAIDRHLEGDRQMHLPDGDLPEVVTRDGASFVTLERAGRLLGCTGSMVPSRPLIEDVAIHAVTSAFADPRLPAITRADWHEMCVKISVLGPLERLDVDSTEDLARAIRPGVDGLLVEGGGRRATFLPSVWEKVDGADEFLELLWRKAGLHEASWPHDMVVERYTTVEFTDTGPR
ncbi:MAG: AmmeMemoRadiSam system protein B [Acidimicrobiia bacterium]|nr:AmmeMemoRadiSam system protein B [Acidimicrobiia bacterium]